MIHPTAIVDPAAELASDVEIGPFAYVGPRCVLHSGVKIGMRAIVEKDCEIGRGTIICPNAYVGGEPQDFGYKGEQTKIKIGENNTIREFVTVHRATVKENWETLIGNNCYLMAYSHIAHDCVLGNHVTLANSATLSGHVHVGDYAFISGLTGVHQFVHIGTSCMIAALSRISKDTPAFTTVFNDDVIGLNIVGLRRRGISAEVRTALKKALHIFLDKGLRLEDAKKELEQLEQYPEIVIFRESLENSKRGIIRKG